MKTNDDGYFSDAEAMEDLRNKSICVKELKQIRNINSEKDLRRSKLVFVNNLSADGSPLDIIQKGTMVRYKLISNIR